jgi:hypothetical protein
MTRVHPVASTDLDVRPRPYPDAAPDSPASDSLAQVFCEEHLAPNSIAAAPAVLHLVLARIVSVLLRL